MGFEEIVKGDLGSFLDSFFKGYKFERTKKGYQDDLMAFAHYIKHPTVKKGVTDLAWKREEAVGVCEKLFFGPPGSAWGEAQAYALVTDYKNDLAAAGFASAAVNRRITVLKSLTKAAKKRGTLGWNLDDLPYETVEEPDKLTAGPGDEVVKAMVAYLETQPAGAQKYRDLAILRMCFDTALRRAEIANLDIQDINFDKLEILVLRKGKKIKKIFPILQRTADAVKKWLEYRKDTKGPLFIPFGGKVKDECGKYLRLSGTSIYRIVSGLGEAVGKKVWPHGIRHTTLTKGREAGGTAREVMGLAGHNKEETFNKNYDDAKAQLARRAMETIEKARYGHEG